MAYWRFWHIQKARYRVVQYVLVLAVFLVFIFIANILLGPTTNYPTSEILQNIQSKSRITTEHVSPSKLCITTEHVSPSKSGITTEHVPLKLKDNRDKYDAKPSRTYTKILNSGWTIYNPKYISHGNNITDILYMKPIKFNPKFKNPCWIENTRGKNELHCLAYFFIAGFMKCATSDLHNRLVQHPQIRVSYRKETKFWSNTRYSGMTLSSHSRLIAKRLISTDSDTWYRVASHYIVGDATPLTLSDHYSCRLDPNNGGSMYDSNIPKYRNPHFIRHLLPDAKMIVLMRNPADRLYSGFHFMYSLRERSLHNPASHPTPEEFHWNTVRAVKIMDACRMKYGHYKCIIDFSLTSDMPNSMVDYHITSYATIIKDWLDIFPRQQFLFIRTEDYDENIAYYIRKIVAFLELDTLSPRHIKRIAGLNRKNKQPRYPPMANRTRELIDRYYLSERRELSALLGDDRFLWEEFLQTRSAK